MEAQDSPNFHNMIEPLTPQGAKGHYAHRFLCADICHNLWGSKLIAGPSFRFADLSAEGAYQSNGATVRANEDAWGRRITACWEDDQDTWNAWKPTCTNFIEQLPILEDNMGALFKETAV